MRKVEISGYVSEVNDTHFIMWMENHEHIKKLINTYKKVEFSPLRGYQSIKIWKGKLYDEIIKSGMTPSELLLSMKDVDLECSISRTDKSINVTAIKFIFNNVAD
jgi:hypothetical protein